MSSDGERRFRGLALPYLLIAMAAALLVGLFLLPFGQALLLSLSGSAEGRFGWYAQFLSSAYLEDLGFTMLIGLATAVLAMLIAIPLALLLRQPFRGRGLLSVMILLPLVVPHIIAAYALWLIMARTGPLFTLLVERLHLMAEPPVLDGSWGGLLIALVWKFFPVTTLTAAAALESLDPALEEAARDCGAGFMRRLGEIVLPLIAPSLLAGGTLVFVLAVAQFSITLIVHGGTGTTTIPLDIYYETFGLNRWGYGSALGIILTAITLGFLAVVNTLSPRRCHA